MKKHLSLWALATLTLGGALGCASAVQRAEISAEADPAQEIQMTEAAIQEGYDQQFDVLAPKAFSSSQAALKDAKEALEDGDGREDVLENVAIARGYLNQAQEKVAARERSLTAVTDARMKALEAGARDDKATRERLKKIDNDLRSDSEDADNLGASEIAGYQKQYLDLELSALHAANLGAAKAALKQHRNNAEKYAPETLRRADLDVKTAENAIDTERRTPQGYAAPVARANASVKLLSEVLDENKKAGWDLDETTALRMVNQNRRISGLEGELELADSASAAMGQALDQQSARLAASGAAISMQQALNKARQQFSEDEAEVYQQGDKLLIRLKSMNFKSGSANVPQASRALLDKVKNVTQQLNPEQVVIEGHTDAVGTAAVNNKLSKARAEAVANYFEQGGFDQEVIESVGLGFQRPIADNKTARGRATNRRVDVIITPSAESSRAPASVVE